MSRIHSHTLNACLRLLTRQSKPTLTPISPSLLTGSTVSKQLNARFSTLRNHKRESNGSGGHSNGTSGDGTGGDAGRADGAAWSSKKVTLLCISLCGITGFAGYSLDSWKRGDYGSHVVHHSREEVINGNMPKGSPIYGSPDEMESVCLFLSICLS